MKTDEGQWVIAEKGEKQENPDIADVYNTVLKMAKKRAMVDAVLTITAASDIFTQDLEEQNRPELAAPAENKKIEQKAEPEPVKKEADKPTGESLDFSNPPDFDKIAAEHLEAIAKMKSNGQPGQYWKKHEASILSMPTKNRDQVQKALKDRESALKPKAEDQAA